MSGEIDSETKLKIYMLMVNRYKDLIKEKETKSVSEIRQFTSPYNDQLKDLRKKLISDLEPFSHEKHFLIATQKAISYIREVKTCRFMIPFWMEFQEIDDLKVAGIMDKAILLTALIRSFGSEDVLVKVTKKNKVYVAFSWEKENYLFVPETGSLLAGDDITTIFEKDPIAYLFSDLVYENYEED